MQERNSGQLSTDAIVNSTTTVSSTTNEFDAFRSLTKKLLNVSKAELDKERAKA